MTNLWRNFWYGMSLVDFLRAELRWTPSRRIFTVRLFIILMIISLVSVTLRPPATVALSFAFVMMLGSSMTDYTMTLQTALRLVKLVLAAIGLSIISMALWSDQPWFLVPWSFGLITLLLFHSRTAGAPTIAAVLYVAAVLLNPERPDQNILTALWFFPTLVLLTFGTSIAAHLVFWPQDPLTVLRQHLTGRFDAIIRMLDRLAEHQPENGSGPGPDIREKPYPGAISRHFHLLANAEHAHPEIKVKHPEWIDLIVEVDTGFNNVSALARLMLETHPRPRFTGREFARLQDIAAECRSLRNDFLASRAPSAESTLRIPDEDSPNTLPDTPVTHFLHRLDDVALGARKTLAGLYGPESRPGPSATEPEPEIIPMEWSAYLGKDYWTDNLDALHYGMKFALGVIICLFVIQALRWPDIGTAMLTCVIVAQTSLGASYRMSVLRIVGAILGGLLAYVFIIVLQPALETIAGFLLAIAPVCWLAAWVGSGSPRIAYIGTQIGFSFANAILPGYGPVTELNTAWDRVLGILLGITVVGVIDYLLWPQHSERLAIDRLGLTLRTLGKFLMLETTMAGQTPSSAVLMRAIDSDLQKAANLLENAEIEPGSNRPETSARILTLDLIIDTMHGIARVVQARHRYYLDEAFRAKAEPLLEHQDAFNRSLSEVLNFLADTVENKPITTPPSARPVLKKFHNSTRPLTMNPALDWETRKSLLACADLDKILLDYLEELDSLITDLAQSHLAEFRKRLEK